MDAACAAGCTCSPLLANMSGSGAPAEKPVTRGDDAAGPTRKENPVAGTAPPVVVAVAVEAAGVKLTGAAGAGAAPPPFTMLKNDGTGLGAKGDAGIGEDKNAKDDSRALTLPKDGWWIGIGARAGCVGAGVGDA